MAAFCAFFPWCDPDTYLNLPVAVWMRLAAVIRDAEMEGR